MTEAIERHLEAFEKLSEIQQMAAVFGQATEKAAIAAADLSGRGEKIKADQAAVDAMRHYLMRLDISAVVEVGEGIKDEAPMLYIGEKLGTGGGPELSIAVDPIDGTDATAGLMPGAISTLAVSEGGGILRLSPDLFYVDKLITGPQAKDKVDINAPASENVEAIAKALGKDVSDLKIVVLDRPRNKELIENIRKVGAKVSLIKYGDLIPGVLTCIQGTDVHAVMGVGGAPEAVLSAAGVICLGGGIQARPYPKDDANEAKLLASGVDMNKVYTERDLVPGKSVIFSATGITQSNVIEGVRTFKGGLRVDTFLLAATDGVSVVTRKDTTLVTKTDEVWYRLR